MIIQVGYLLNMIYFYIKISSILSFELSKIFHTLFASGFLTKIATA